MLFDIIVGNPPYGDLKSNSDNKAIYDLSSAFIISSMGYINRNGNLCLIFPHKFLNTKMTSYFRDWLMSGRYINTLIHFGANKVFKNANTLTCITLMSKSLHDNIFYKTIKTGSPKLNLLKYSEIDEMSKIYGKNNWILFSNDLEKNIFKKIQSTITLGTLIDIKSGLLTNFDNLYILTKNIDGSYTLPYNNKNYYLEETFLKPVLKGKDVHKYESLYTDKFIFYPYKKKWKHN